MNDTQYEELCRFFIAKQFGISPEKVLSVRITNPRRPGLPEYKHQIDLYWETGNEAALYLNIANAKWRSSVKVDQPDVMLLQQVRQKVAAHKAFMITNTEFTSGAVAAAKDDGIALHIVRPCEKLHIPEGKDRIAIQVHLQTVAGTLGEIYSSTIVNRGLDTTPSAPPPSAPVSSPSVPAGAIHRAITGPTSSGSASSGNRGSGSGQGTGNRGFGGSSRGGGFNSR